MRAYPPLQCLTLDGHALSHEAQVRALCLAGSEWVQLRMKQATDAEVRVVAATVLPVCRAAGCRLIINDRVSVALDVGADGVHLGKRDMGWTEARSLLGPEKLLGGTVNSLKDAEWVVQSGVLNYVGVGPYRFTPTKENLAPVLSEEQWRAILKCLGSMPAYAIGGIEADDFPAIHRLGVRGCALATALYREGAVEMNCKRIAAAWRACSAGNTGVA